MALANRKPVPLGKALNAASSRRRALALMLGASRWLPATPAAADSGGPIRMAISESLIGSVNLNDARAAMLVWFKQMAQDLNLACELKLTDTQAILDGARKGQWDALGLNVIEYRSIAELLDSSQIVNAAGAAGLERYIILAKRSSGLRQLGDLKGRRLSMLQTPKMCVAPAWLSTILAEGHYPPAEQFFGSVVTDAKVSRVVLPVFFGQADACLTSERGFRTMAELNPQVSTDLTVLAGSPAMVVDFYIFRKNYDRARRQKVITAMSSLHATPAGRQIAVLFQVGEVTVRDAGCLTSVLGVLARADLANGRRDAGSGKG